jgi:hypothetical protein
MGASFACRGEHQWNREWRILVVDAGVNQKASPA